MHRVNTGVDSSLHGLSTDDLQSKWSIESNEHKPHLLLANGETTVNTGSSLHGLRARCVSRSEAGFRERHPAARADVSAMVCNGLIKRGANVVKAQLLQRHAKEYKRKQEPRCKQTVCRPRNHPFREVSTYRTIPEWRFAVPSLKKPSAHRNIRFSCILISRFDSTYNPYGCQRSVMDAINADWIGGDVSRREEDRAVEKRALLIALLLIAADFRHQCRTPSGKAQESEIALPNIFVMGATCTSQIGKDTAWETGCEGQLPYFYVLTRLFAWKWTRPRQFSYLSVYHL